MPDRRYCWRCRVRADSALGGERADQAGNFAPTPNQALPYRLFTHDLAGQPTDVHHRDAVGQVVIHDKLDWDAGARAAGGGKLRRLFCVGAAQERYRAKYDGAGDRVEAVNNGVNHIYSYGAGLLHDSAGNTVYTPGISQRQNGVDAFFHGDWLGSTRYLTEGTGLIAPTAYRFDAFGVQTAAGGPDATGVKFAGAQGWLSDVPGGVTYAKGTYVDPRVAELFQRSAARGAAAIVPAGEAGLVGAQGAALAGTSQGAAAATRGVAAQSGFFAASGGRVGVIARIAGSGVARTNVLGAGVGAAIELGAYQPGTPSGPLTYLGESLGHVFFPDPQALPADLAFVARWAVARVVVAASNCQTALPAAPPRTGQTHHVLSRKIMRELGQHRTLSGAYRRNDPRFKARAIDKNAHEGYQQWHRDYDDRVVDWLQRNRNATPSQFENFLRQLHRDAIMKRRFPNYSGP